MELSKEENVLRMKLKLAEHKSYWDIKDVSLKTGLSVATLRRRLADGRLKAMQSVPHGKLLFDPQAIKDFLNGQG